jgi:hypothetical protein
MSTTHTRRLTLILALLLLYREPATGQSLADVARKEQERRKAITTTSKVYSNESLSEVPPVSVVGAEAAVEKEAETDPSGREAAGRAKASPAEQPANRPTAGDDRRDEKYWRSRITDARAELSRQELFLQALQTRVNSLTSDFVARDDPAQRGVLAGDRQKSLAEMERVRADIQRLTTTIHDIEEEARRAAVPPGWLR